MVKNKKIKKKPLFTYKKELLKREFTLEGIMENIGIIICITSLCMLIWIISIIIYCLVY